MSKCRLIFIVIMMTVFAITCSLISSFLIKKTSINSPYTDEFIDEMKESAKQGNVQAQYNLGMMYKGDINHSSYDSPKNYKEAIKWLTKVAEQGNVNGQVNLASMYEDGQGTPQNYEEAIKWYTQAATQGDADAQYALGLVYRRALKNDKEAFEWYTKAAEKGHEDAQFTLASMYQYGQGVPQNDEQAYIWASLATAQYDAPENAEKLRDLAAEKLTPEQLIAAQQRAAELQKQIEANAKTP
jgi:hypothetical protein